MRTRPKTLPATASVADAHRFFENPHVLTALLVDERGGLAGAIERGALPESARPEEPALDYAERSPERIEADTPALLALERMNATGVRRLVVVEEETGLLQGLVCLTAGGDSFCG
jgi:CBS domain-containing protein